MKPFGARPSHIAKHDHMRKFPNRLNQQIARAATSAGLKNIYLEWPREAIEGRKHYLWYDVKGKYKETLWLFEIQPGGKKSWIQDSRASSHSDKIDWAIHNNAEFMIIPAFGHNEQTITILIKEQLMRRK